MKRKRIKVLCVCLSIILVFSGCTTTITATSLDNYLKTDAPLNYSEFVLFPEKVNLTTKYVNFYRSENVSSLLFDDVYFLLSCTYSDICFANELTRIQGRGAEYREDLFQYPAYVMLFYEKYFEYALVDHQTYSIIYIAAETTNFRYFSDFPNDFIPNDLAGIDICHY